MRRLVLASIVVLGCTEDDGSVGDVDTDVSSDTDAAVTFHGDVRPIFDRRCASCHQAGGIGSFDMTWSDDPEADDGWWFAAASSAVANGQMPPWMPDESCHPHQDPRVLSEAELATVAAWAEADHPVGDPADYRPPEDPGEVAPPDLTLRSAEPYAPDPSRPDDYRCFVLDHDFDAETWITGFGVAPDRVELVHHVLVYRLEPDLADDIAGWDAEDEGPGYTCFGSPGTWEADTVSGWAPGQQPELYGGGVARRIPEGSVLVMQVHYNLLNLDDDAPVPEDHTGIQLWVLPEGERPLHELFSIPLANMDLDIPAGDPSVSQELEIDIDLPIPKTRIRGTFPHMHTLGTSVRVDVLREDETESCVVDIPEWDFNWQQTFFFPESDPVWVSGKDRLRLTCTYDNSASNQPTVNGAQQEPRDVTWGDGTFDEMCLVYLYATLPVGP